MESWYIDINSDVGEGVGNETKLFPYITSCNIACGGHAGDENSIRQILKLSKEHIVKIGAHPSYPDRENFGRKAMGISPEKLQKSIQEQLATFVKIVKEEDVHLHHIKPHGALYNDIAKDRQLAIIFLKAIEKYKEQVFLYAPYASEIAKEADKQNFKIKFEAFGDRNYNPDLSLVSRTRENALIQDPEEVLMHIVQIIKTNTVNTVSGQSPKILADTFCIHGDTPSALKILMYLSQELPNHQAQPNK